MTTHDATSRTLNAVEQPGPQVWHMGLIHRIFRAQFVELVQIIRQVGDTDLVRRKAVLDHLDFNLTGLHHHHLGEDTHLWPLLATRVPGSAAEQMHPQHEVIGGHLTEVRELMTAWETAPAGPSAADAADALATKLGEFTRLLTDHLDEEERLVVPLIAQHLSAQEWKNFGRSMNDSMPKSAMPIMQGTLLEVATPTEAKEFIGDLPWPVRLMIRMEGGKKYAKYIAAVRGEN